MTAITVAQVLSARFRVSKEMDEVTSQLHSDLSLGSKGRLVRLALGRSLGLGAFTSTPDAETDLKGQEVPARAVFRDEDVEVWLGLLVAHAKQFGPEKIDSMESLRRAIRSHWQRGVQALRDDWGEAGENYEKFVHSLVERRAYLRGRSGSESDNGSAANAKRLEDASAQITRALGELGIDADVRGEPVHGPRTTRYRLYMRDANQLGQLERKTREIALLLNVQAGLPTVVRGDEARVVFLSVPRPRSTWNVVGREAFQRWLSSSVGLDPDLLPVFLGLDELGNPIQLELATAPHLFVAGTTGSGKSVCMHSIVASLITTQSPERIQLALIDPKQVEFAYYERYKSLYQGSIAYDAASAFAMLNELVVEMDARYSFFRQRGVTSWTEAKAAGVAPPRIVVLVEELADLLMSRRDADRPLIALAQKARAAGIHLVLATQRPDAKTFSGLLRSNIPSRIALTVQKATESSIILDESGAEDLLGSGDMLVKVNGEPKRRVHGVFLDRPFLEGLVRN